MFNVPDQFCRNSRLILYGIEIQHIIEKYLLLADRTLGFGALELHH